jgi:hypothetical protein
VSQPYELRDLHLSWPKPESEEGAS